eukprot:gene16693-biopygen6335
MTMLVSNSGNSLLSSHGSTACGLLLACCPTLCRGFPTLRCMPFRRADGGLRRSHLPHFELHAAPCSVPALRGSMTAGTMLHAPPITSTSDSITARWAVARPAVSARRTTVCARMNERNVNRPSVPGAGDARQCPQPAPDPGMVGGRGRIFLRHLRRGQ